MRAHFVLTVIAGLALLTACPEPGPGTPTVSMDFKASNWNPAQGEVVVFTVTASVSQGDITLCEIWFDGGPSEIHYFKSPTISTTFSHAYFVPGSYMVRVQLQNENGSIGSQEKLLKVSAGPV
jgi:hypothetical protein